MPDLEKDSPYPFLNRISTEELKRILREDFESEGSGSPENDEFIACAAEVIARREADNPDVPHFDAAAGWKDFQQNYQPGEEHPILMCGEAELDELIKHGGQKRQADLKPRQPSRAFHRILRMAAIAAIVASLCAAAAGALEVNVFEIVARWTQDIFQFQSEETLSHNAAYESGTFLEDGQTLKPLLEEAGITRAVCPRWIPDGYKFSETRSFSELNDLTFVASYEDESTKYQIIASVIAHNKARGTRTEKDAVNMITYRKNNTEHYIMGNEGIMTAAWFIDNLECGITGRISEREMEAMIDSIYKE